MTVFADLQAGVTALAQGVAAKINGLRPKIQVPIYYDTLAGNTYTCTAADAGREFIWNGAGDLVFVVPDALPDGFNIKISQFAAGRVLINPVNKVYFANGSAPGLILPGQSAYLTVATVNAGGNPVRILNVSFDQPLPVSHVVNSAVATRNATAMTAVPGLAVNLDAASVYEVDVMVTFSASITTNTLKLGFLALPTSSTGQFDGCVYNTNVSGTAAAVRKSMLTSAEAVAGVVGSSAVISVPLLARITGRIRTVDGGAGVLTVTAGSIAATGAITIAAGAASMLVRKIQ